MTKWERFAKSKGIAPKPKKDKVVFDEQSQSWYVFTQLSPLFIYYCCTGKLTTLFDFPPQGTSMGI
jgi:hypothetical protein